MPIFENRGSYLFVQIIEPYSLPGVVSCLSNLAERCQEEHLEKVLIDASRLEGPISIWDRYQIGREYIKVIGPKINIALVTPRELINSVLENVIVNRTGTLKVFHQMAPALAWLEAEVYEQPARSFSSRQGKKEMER